MLLGSPTSYNRSPATAVASSGDPRVGAIAFGVKRWDGGGHGGVRTPTCSLGRCVEARAGAVQSKVVISAQRLVCLASRYLAGAMTVEGGDGRGYSISCVPVVV